MAARSLVRRPAFTSGISDPQLVSEAKNRAKWLFFNFFFLMFIFCPRSCSGVNSAGALGHYCRFRAEPRPENPPKHAESGWGGGAGIYPPQGLLLAASPTL